VLWPLRAGFALESKDLSPHGLLRWERPVRIHQSTSKTLASDKFDSGATLIVSGGDDGSLSFLLSESNSPDHDPTDLDKETSCIHAAVVVTRAHASAVTACAIVSQKSRLFVVTSGNDQWVRLWEVQLRTPDALIVGETVGNEDSDPLEIKRLKKMKTNVADVSSMALLGHGEDGEAARVLICGIGMEVIRIE
jgi:WD40 repeat protein